MKKPRAARASAETITVDALSRLSFTNSKRLPKFVSDYGRRKRWVGIGWVDEGPAQPGDVVVVRDPIVFPKGTRLDTIADVVRALWSHLAVSIRPTEVTPTRKPKGLRYVTRTFKTQRGRCLEIRDGFTPDARLLCGYDTLSPQYDGAAHYIAEWANSYAKGA